MKLYNKLIFILFFITFSQCTTQPIDSYKCKKLKKTSKQYISCMNEVIKSTNTAANLKEFKKHKTFKSFFKQVEVIPSN